MRAVVHKQYGSPGVLRLEDVERPVPKSDEVLIRIHATTVTRTDCALREGTIGTRLGMRLLGLGGLLRPKLRILGSELAGEVEEIGAAVSQFQVGDRVFGVNERAFGTNAELVCMRESSPLAHMPARMTFQEAAAVCDGALLALNSLRPASPHKGQRILVYGASGSIGTAAVQLASYFQAEVTAVCNANHIETVRSLGADKVIDYVQEDFTKSGETYDVIFDAVGTLKFRNCLGSLDKGGLYLATDGVPNIILALLTSRTTGKKVIFPVPPRYTRDDVRFLAELIERGKYRAVIDRYYPLEDVVDATTYVETKKKKGNVVLTVLTDSET